MLVFLTTANDAIMSLPNVAVLHRRMHRTLSEEPEARFGRAPGGQGLRPLASDLNARATESPNALLAENAPSSREILSCRVVSLLIWNFRSGQQIRVNRKRTPG